MKKIIIFFLFLILPLCFTNEAYSLHGNYDEFLEDIPKEKHTSLIIPKGSFFRCFNGQDISSEFNNNDDIIKFLVPSDFTMNNEIVVPKNSMFIGVVKNLQKAEQGRNGFFSINIVGLIFPDGTRFSAKGYVVNGKDNRTFGGDFTRRTGHKTTVHRSACFKAYYRNGTSLLQQDGERIMGEETLLKMGELKTIVIEESILIKE